MHAVPIRSVADGDAVLPRFLATSSLDIHLTTFKQSRFLLDEA